MGIKNVCVYAWVSQGSDWIKLHNNGEGRRRKDLQKKKKIEENNESYSQF